MPCLTLYEHAFLIRTYTYIRMYLQGIPTINICQFYEMYFRLHLITFLQERLI